MSLQDLIYSGKNETFKKLYVSKYLGIPVLIARGLDYFSLFFIIFKLISSMGALSEGTGSVPRIPV